MSASEPTGAVIGHMYVGKRSCGRVAAMCWDDPKYAKDTANTVADYINSGYTVERLTRRQGDPLPTLICDECRGGRPCKDSATVATAGAAA